MPRPEHTVHKFDRELSRADDGRGLFGCTYRMCGATEIRQLGTPSPFAMKRRAEQRRKAERQTAQGGR